MATILPLVVSANVTEIARRGIAFVHVAAGFTLVPVVAQLRLRTRSAPL